MRSYLLAQLKRLLCSKQQVALCFANLTCNFLLDLNLYFLLFLDISKATSYQRPFGRQYNEHHFLKFPSSTYAHTVEAGQVSLSPIFV